MGSEYYDLGDPLRLAKAVNFSKQALGQAVKDGLIDVAPATLAAMAIDRISADQAKPPTQTVAQQVLAPPQPPMPPQGGMPPAPAGLGATPEAGAMPPMGGAPQPQMPPMPQMAQAGPPMDGGAPVMGMAEGGMVGPYAAGGLSDLPVPDTMFDEPSNGGYAGGGIVAFAAAGPVNSKLLQAPGGNLADTFMPSYTEGEQFFTQHMPQPKHEARDMWRADVQSTLSKEGQAKEAKYDKYAFLADLGARLSSTPGPFLAALGASATAALPGLKESKKERELRRHQAIKDYAEIEGLDNEEAKAKVNFALSYAKNKVDLTNQDLSRDLDWTKAVMSDETQRYGIKAQAGATLGAARIHANASKSASNAANLRELMQARGLATSEASKLAMADPEFRTATKPAQKNAIIQRYYGQALERILASGGGGGTPELGADYVLDS